MTALVLAALLCAPPSEAPKQIPLSVGNEKASIALGLGVQFRTTVNHTVGVGTDSALQLHRGRLFARGRFGDDDQLKFKLQLDVAPRALELIDLSGDIKLTPALSTRIGIAKIPFTLHWDTSFLDLHFVDWPLTTRWFGGGRQLGIQFFDRRPGQGLRLSGGIYAGESLRPANGARFATLYGDKVPNRLSLQRFTPPGAPHPEVVARATYNASPVRLALSAAWDIRPEHTVDETLRVAADTDVALGKVRLWYGAFASISRGAEGEHFLALAGQLAGVAWRVHPHLVLGVRHASILTTPSLRADARAHAQREIAALEAEDASRYEDVGRMIAQQELTTSLSVPFLQDHAQIMADASWTATAGLGTQALRFRLQAQLRF